MRGNIALKVENLGKRYTIGVERHDMLRDTLSDFRWQMWYDVGTWERENV